MELQGVQKAWSHRSMRVDESIPLYVLMLPAVVYLILFNYIPMYGITIAFKDFSIREGILGSGWVGFKHFARFFRTAQFGDLIRNTLTINILSLAAFPFPIILALMLNYCISRRFKKLVQMLTYAPHFISLVVLVSMMNLFFSVNNGVFNNLIHLFGGERVNFLIRPETFKYLFVGSGVWQQTGFASIIYIGTLVSVSPDLHEAAIVDGATKLQRIRHVDLPRIAPTIIIMFIMRIGRLMDLGFQKVYLMQNDANLIASEVISTYVYKVGLLQNNFSYSTAINLFNTAINILLLLIANYLSRRVAKTSLF